MGNDAVKHFWFCVVPLPFSAISMVRVNPGCRRFLNYYSGWFPPGYECCGRTWPSCKSFFLIPSLAPSPLAPSPAPMTWIFLGGGWLLAFMYFVSGLIYCAFIITLPFGVQCFKLASLSLSPFGSQVVNEPTATECLATFCNLRWVFTGGLAIGLTHFIFAALCALTIVGIPFALQHIKLVALRMMPFGKTVR